MICYSIRFIKILPDKALPVVAALRRDGLFAELKKQIPGHIGCSILESDLTNDLYLVIDFWRSKYDFFENELLPSGIFLSGVLGRLSYRSSSLGPFSFPEALPETSVNHEIDPNSGLTSEVENAKLIHR